MFPPRSLVELFVCPGRVACMICGFYSLRLYIEVGSDQRVFFLWTSDRVPIRRAFQNIRNLILATKHSPKKSLRSVLNAQIVSLVISSSPSFLVFSLDPLFFLRVRLVENSRVKINVLSMSQIRVFCFRPHEDCRNAMRR